MRLILLFLFASLLGRTSGQESQALSPLQSFDLHEDLKESSGLIYWDASLWTHNDSEDNTLYRIDPASGKIKDRILLEGVVNTDWEDIAQDKDFIYIGDIGNNSGNRKALHILRIAKESLGKERIQIDSISFSYENQVDFTSRPQATDFDCEAMILHNGQIFLFTKEWISAGTTIYSLPANPGSHLARKVSSYPVEGLITGADITADGSMIILCGYSSMIQPFLVVLRDLSGESHKRVPLALPYFQVEGIAIKSAEEIFISNEFLRLGSLVQVRQQLHRVSGW